MSRWHGIPDAKDPRGPCEPISSAAGTVSLRGHSGCGLAQVTLTQVYMIQKTIKFNNENTQNKRARKKGSPLSGRGYER